MISDNESVSAESETDYSNLNIDPIAKSDSYSPYIIDSNLADSNVFSLGIILISDRPIANY
jgi:hypothetical protein